MPVVFCPICRHRHNEGLRSVTQHMNDAHNIYVTQPYPDGFHCRQPDCVNWFAVYKSWQRHIRVDHGGGLDDLVQVEGHDIAGGAVEMDVDEGGDIPNLDPVEADGAVVQMDVVEGGDIPNIDPVEADAAVGHVDPPEVGGPLADVADPLLGLQGDADSEHASTSEESGADSDASFASEQSAGEEDDGNAELDLRKLAVDMVVDLRSHCTMNRTEVRVAMAGCDSILRGYSDTVTARVNLFLQNQNLLGNPEAARLMESLTFNSPFNGMRSDKGQVSATKEFYKFIPPQTLHLQDRIEPVNVGGGNFRQRPVGQNLQYVSPKEILKLLVPKENVMEYVNNLEPRNDGLLTTYTDGDLYQTHPFFRQYPKAFQLVLYFDEFEVVNKQGTKCQIHTIAAFYLIILNVPPHINSALNSIHVVALANYDDIKTFGFRVVLQPLLDDLLELESPEGVHVVLSERHHTLRASLVAFTGDTKAAHEIFEFLGAGARHFCRLCMISRQELHMGHVVLGERRTEELHEHHLQLLAQNPGNSTITGLAGNSCLHDLRYFRYWYNYVFDVFHDMVGIAHLIIPLVLRKFILLEGYFRTVDLNRRIKSFNYGVQDIKNRPTANFSDDKLRAALRKHTMKQTGAQTFCLLRALPFLLDGFVPDEEDDRYLEIVVLLQRIVELALAPRIPRTMIPYFTQVIEDYRRARFDLFPDVPLINKEHHKDHYPECCLKMGALKAYWCMRCEGAHRPLRRHIITCNNYKNACKTAMEAAQFAQAAAWGTDSATINDKVKFITAVVDKPVNDLLSRDLLMTRGFNADDVVRTSKKVSVYGTEYGIGQFVITRPASQNNNGMPSFGKIRGIIIANGDVDVWLEVEEWETDGLDERLNAFVIFPIPNAGVHIHDTERLPLHPPLSIWNDYTTERQYMCLKHFVA